MIELSGEGKIPDYSPAPFNDMRKKIIFRKLSYLQIIAYEPKLQISCCGISKKFGPSKVQVL